MLVRDMLLILAGTGLGSADRRVRLRIELYGGTVMQCRYLMLIELTS